MLDTYRINNTIAVGEYSKVKLVEDPQGKMFTAKVMYYTTESSKKLVSGLLLNEIKSLQVLSNAHTVQLVASSLDGKSVKKGKTKLCVYLISNYCELGSLYNLAKLGPTESAARYFFLKSVSALQAIHSQGIRHQNLRVENLLIDAQLNIRICGLSKSACMEESKNLRHSSYSAPEILAYKCCNGKKTDIFALGVVLFVIVCGVLPFHRASATDCLFKLLQTNSKGYWSNFLTVSEEFKELIQGMLKEDPDARFDVENVIATRWAKGDVVNDDVELIQTKLINFI